MRRIVVFDTTLRDGEQAPGASLGRSQKLTVAKALADLGVDVIEAGFAAASDGEADAIDSISREVTSSGVASLARANRTDVEAAARALQKARRARIHVFIATSDIHLERKLGIDRDTCLERIDAAVEYALQHADDVEFSAEDATRTEPEFLIKAFRTAASAGARTINVPDTVGYAQPAEFAGLVSQVRTALGAEMRISVHCHNDLGLAVANTLAAVVAGADQVHVTINGLGERGGNASLEETVMALRCRRDWYVADTGVHAERLVPMSRLVTELTGIPVQPNKAVVGANAFAHASGIHQDGVLKDPLTYEIMTPESVGWPSRRIVVSKLSGRRGLAARLAELGVPLEGASLERAYVLAKTRGDEVHVLEDRDLVAIASEARRAVPVPIASA